MINEALRPNSTGNTGREVCTEYKQNCGNNSAASNQRIADSDDKMAAAAAAIIAAAKAGVPVKADVTGNTDKRCGANSSSGTIPCSDKNVPRTASGQPSSELAWDRGEGGAEILTGLVKEELAKAGIQVVTLTMEQIARGRTCVPTPTRVCIVPNGNGNLSGTRGADVDLRFIDGGGRQPFDACPGIPGDQPAGYDCDPRPIDVCPDEPGVQLPGTVCPTTGRQLQDQQQEQQQQQQQQQSPVTEPPRPVRPS